MKVSSRYSYLDNEEIVLLQGSGCFWKQCRFCDYYLDSNRPEQAHQINKEVLKNVTGDKGKLTVINSGSYFELPQATKNLIEEILISKDISSLTIEAHYAYKDQVEKLRKKLENLGINLIVRIGIETFDENFREEILKKGMGKVDINEVSKVFDECCLLYGIKGQSEETLLSDLKTALENFDAVYLNIYEDRNGFPADKELIDNFIKDIYPAIKDEPKLNVLINVTDLGVG